MIRTIHVAFVLAALSVAGNVRAQTTTWWNSAYSSSAMINKDQATTWLASDGDTMTKIVRTSYGIPTDKQSTIDSVIAAVMKFNNALSGNNSLYDANKVTPIVDKNKIYANKLYFIPDPTAIDRILKGEDPALVMKDSMKNGGNQEQAKGTATFTPMHAHGDIEPNAADTADAGAPAGTGVTGGTGTTTSAPAAPILGPDDRRRNGDTTMLDIHPEHGPVRADGASDIPETYAQSYLRGNIAYETSLGFVTASPVARYGDPIRLGAKTGVGAGELSGQTN